MANGRPGDHPFTDIVVHRRSDEFGEEISDLVRAMHAHTGFGVVREEVIGMLGSIEFRPDTGDRAEKLARLLQRLVALKARMETE